MAKRKKRKYKHIEISLSDRQHKSLLNYCNAREISPVKLIKKLLKNYTIGFEKSVPPEYYNKHKQLNLFEPDEDNC